MAKRGLTIFLASVGMMAIGCAPPPPPPPPTPNGFIHAEEDFDSFKAAYQKANPDARIGRVTAVLTNEHRLSVGDISTADFARGDILTILDYAGDVLADGTVEDMDADTLYVQYTLSTTATFREPRAGDIAIRALPPDRL